MSAQFKKNTKNYLPVRDVAVRVGYTSDYVARLARENKVDAVKDGRQWCVDPDSVKLFLLEVEEKKRSRGDQIRNERFAERAKFHTQIANEKINDAIHDTYFVAFLQTVVVGLCFFIFSSLVWFSFEQELDVARIASGATHLTRSLGEQVIAPVPDMFNQVASFAFIADERNSGKSFKQHTPVEENVFRPENSDFQGVILLDNSEHTEENKLDQLRESFSDEVRVDFEDDHTGVITPEFKKHDGDSYRFLLVPVSSSEHE